MKKLFKFIIEFIFTKHHFFDTKKHIISKEIKQQIDNLKYYDISNLIGAKKEWHYNLNELIDSLKNNKLKDFLKLDVIRRTMYISRADFTLSQLYYLPTKKYLKENFVGSPLMYYRYPLYSANRIHHQFHLYNFDINFYDFIKKVNFIFEFGGGYGSICENIFRHKYQGKYLIYDFKELSIIQQYYLSNTLDDFNFKNIDFVNELYDMSDLKDKIKNSKSLFIATWSISEADLETRKIFKESILNDFDNYLIAFQNKFNEIDNLKYFKEFMLNNKRIEWELKLIDNSISKNMNQYYLFGKKKLD